jgi:tRNA-2-methylthio-N6-dimethylallyladenosine synthase
MRRSYRRDRYLGIISRVREAIPEAAITTDIIVGFPGETEQDFAETLEVVREARFANAFTFQYSKRPGTPAATLPDQISPAVVADRYQRLVAVVNDIAWQENLQLEGRTVELMVAEGEGRKDSATHRLSGRGPDNRLVHFAADGAEGIRPGDLVSVEITHAAPHHLIADRLLSVRHTRSGDAWEARQGVATSGGISLGLPTIGVPAPLPDAPACR